MMTFQFLQENVNTTRGSLKLALPHRASCAELSSRLSNVCCSHPDKRKIEKRDLPCKPHYRCKKLTPDQFISNHSMNEWRLEGKGYKNGFSQPFAYIQITPKS